MACCQSLIRLQVPDARADAGHVDGPAHPPGPGHRQGERRPERGGVVVKLAHLCAEPTRDDSGPGDESTPSPVSVAGAVFFQRTDAPARLAKVGAPLPHCESCRRQPGAGVELTYQYLGNEKWYCTRGGCSVTPASEPNYGPSSVDDPGIPPVPEPAAGATSSDDPPIPACKTCGKWMQVVRDTGGAVWGWTCACGVAVNASGPLPATSAKESSDTAGAEGGPTNLDTGLGPGAGEHDPDPCSCEQSNILELRVERLVAGNRQLQRELDGTRASLRDRTDETVELRRLLRHVRALAEEMVRVTEETP